MLRSTIARRVRHAIRDPFESRAGRATLVHCAHHKVGSQWFVAILRDIARHYGLTFSLQPPAQVIVYEHSRNFSAGDLALPIRGSHLVRDPRDVAVSAYHYHLWTTEAWVHEPRADLGGKTYQEHLNSVPKDDGLLVEIERTCGGPVRDMRNWDYERPEFVELRYEDLIADEAGQFRRIFEHYGFTPSAVEQSLQIAEQHSFKAKTGRTVGEVGAQTHLRSGQPGQWRAEFEPQHVARFKELANDVLVRLGYERDDTWTT